MSWDWMCGKRLVLLCMGSDLCGDDAFGYKLYESIQEFEKGRVRIIYACTFPENFITDIVDFKGELVVVFDAADFGGSAGQVQEVDISHLEQLHISTHRTPMKVFAKLLKDKGIDVRFIGVQAQQTDFGQGLCPEVASAVGEVKKMIRTTLFS